MGQPKDEKGAVVFDEVPDEGLQKHDQKYHGGHYDGGDCKYRENRGIETSGASRQPGLYPDLSESWLKDDEVDDLETGKPPQTGLTQAEQTKVDNADVLAARPAETAATPPQISAQDVYQRWEREGATPEVMNDAERLLDGIIDGSLPSVNLPAAMFRDEAVQKLPKWMLMAYVTGAGGASSTTGQNYAEYKAQKRLIESFAKAAGAYTEDVKEYAMNKGGERLGEGLESIVYDYPGAELQQGEGPMVIKAMHLPAICSDTPCMQMERLILGNYFFPETAQRLEKLGPNTKMVLVQPKIRISKEPLEDFARDGWLEAREWESKPDGWGGRRLMTPSELLEVVDTHSGNVVQDVDGNIFNIDPSVKLSPFYDRRKPPQTVRDLVSLPE